MANTAGICTSFFVEAGAGTHNMGAAGDTLKLALFLATATRLYTDTVYNTTGELAASGNYTQGGKTVTGRAWGATTKTAFWTNNDVSLTWTALTSSGAFDAAVLYNSSKSDKEIAVFTFASQSVSAADFTLTMPTNDASTGLLRITGP
jgi:hypothetical protein